MRKIGCRRRASMLALMTACTLAASPGRAQTPAPDTPPPAATVLGQKITPKAATDSQIVVIFGKRHHHRIDPRSYRYCSPDVRGDEEGGSAPDGAGSNADDNVEGSNTDDDGKTADFLLDYFQSFYGNDQVPGTACHGFPDASSEGGRVPDMGIGSGMQRLALGRAEAMAHARHLLDDASAAFDAKDYPRALDLYKKAWDHLGAPEAGLMAGEMYLYGVGSPPDSAQAIVWLRRVAEKPFSPDRAMGFDVKTPNAMTPRIEASMLLARIYSLGYGVTPDPAAARKWYLKAYSFGFIPAAHILGHIYLVGYGGEKSQDKAVSYFRKAAVAGYGPSQYELGFAYYTGSYGLAEDRKTGAGWLMQSARNGFPDALYSVGRLYDLGETLPQDTKKALVYYKEAAVKGQPEAQDALGLFFYTGEIVGKDLVMARKLFAESARRGDEDAMFNLGVMYAHGEGGDGDPALAYAWFMLAGRSGLDKGFAAAKEIEPSLTPEQRQRADNLLSPKA